MKKWWHKFRVWLAQKILPPQPIAKQEVEPTIENTPQMESQNSTPISPQPGLVCPQCSTKIPLNIPTLLSGQPFYCPNCFLEISVNTQESAAALASLRKLQGELDKADKIIQQTKN